jgi:hypothetical protein
MENFRTCPRCYVENPPVARYCGRCGVQLALGEAARLTQATGGLPPRHPAPLPPPEGFSPCRNAPDVFCRWEPSWGGSALSSTEPVTVLLFNGGYSLRDVALSLEGVDAQGGKVFAVQRELAELPRGATARLEVASYELPAPANDIGVTFVSGNVDLGV